MGTQNQAHSVPDEVFSAKELPNLSYLISQWSSAGFQNFLRSGAFEDMTTAAKEGKTGTIFIKDRGMLKFSGKPGDLSLGQIRIILEKIHERHWNDFYFGFASWTFTAGWWEDNPSVGWELRDEWREEMRLETLNPVIQGIDSKKKLTFFLFKRMGHSLAEVLPQPGYRYAAPEEIPFSEKARSLPIVTWSERHKSFVFIEPHRTDPIQNMFEFSHNQAFYLVQTKE